MSTMYNSVIRCVWYKRVAPCGRLRKVIWTGSHRRSAVLRTLCRAHISWSHSLAPVVLPLKGNGVYRPLWAEVRRRRRRCALASFVK